MSRLCRASRPPWSPLQRRRPMVPRSPFFAGVRGFSFSSSSPSSSSSSPPPWSLPSASASSSALPETAGPIGVPEELAQEEDVEFLFDLDSEQCFSGLDANDEEMSLQDALKELHSEDLVSLAMYRAHLAKRYNLPVDPSFGYGLVAELKRRRLPIMKAARLAEAIVDVGIDEGMVAMLLPLCQSAAQGGRGGIGQGRSRQLEAAALLQAMATLRGRLGADALGPLATQILPLLEAFFRAPPEYLKVPAIATVLESIDRLECQLTESQMNAAEDALVLGLTTTPKAHPRFGEAVSRLGHQGSDLEKVNSAIVDVLLENALKGEEGLPILDNLLWQVRVQFRTVEQPALEYGLTEVICERLQAQIHEIEDEALLFLATRIREMRALREGYWNIIAAETLRRLPEMEANVAVGLGKLMVRASTVNMDLKAELMQALVAECKNWIPSLSPTNLAGLLDTLSSSLESRVFLTTLIRPNEEAFRQRLLNLPELGLEGQAVLASLANGGGRTPEDQALWPKWWRDLVIRPWAGELRQIGRTLAAGPSGCGGRAEYVARMEDTVLSDVGEVWSPSFMSAMSFGRPPDAAFVRRALRNTLRRRRKTPSDDLAAGTAFGYAEWDLSVKNYGLDDSSQGPGPDLSSLSSADEVVWTTISRESGVELQSMASKLHEEVDGGLLQHAQVGFLDKRYRRHGDVERVALLKVLAGLRSKGLGRFLLARGPSGMAKFSGVVNIYVDRFTCLSCLGCMIQFRRAFPGIDIRIACAFPPWLPRKLHKSRLTGFSRERCGSQTFQRTLANSSVSGQKLGSII